MGRYRHLTWTDRLTIEKLHAQGATTRAIASRLGVSHSTIVREIKRGAYDALDGRTWLKVRRYSATISQDLAEYRRTAHGRPLKLGHRYDYAAEVSTRIRAGESPDQIVGDLRRRGSWTVSTVTLYRYIDSGYIPGVTNKDLLIKSRLKKRGYRQVRASRAPAGLSIEQRPASVLSRSEFGHWEMDTVIGKAKGKKQAILVLTERFSRYEIIRKIPDKEAAPVMRQVSRILRQLPAGSVKSITVDNGSEFARCSRLPVPVYYCHPFSAWERGSNENCNKIIRRFFPKGSSLEKVTQKDCDAAAMRINSMHRKSLSYYSANDVFEACTNSL